MRRKFRKDLAGDGDTGKISELWILELSHEE